MSTKKKFVLLGALVIAAVLITACGTPGPKGDTGLAGPTGPQGEPGPVANASDLSCAECHNDTNIITGKQVSWTASNHGSGTTTAYAGGRDGCAGCHAGSGFSDRISQGIVKIDDYQTDEVNPSRIDCRACHQIHTSYTKDDFALEITDPVSLYALEGVTFDGGQGNLCAQCHQPRRAFVAVDGIVDWNSTHFGPHHGPQSAMLLGVGGAGDVEGKPSAHYVKVENTCVACHMGEGRSHSFTPNVANCTECHTEAKDFDVNGVQTEIKGLLEELHAALVAKGMLTAEGTSVVGKYPEKDAAALWNYILVAEEDKSMGVHNPGYAKALLEWSIAALK